MSLAKAEASPLTSIGKLRNPRKGHTSEGRPVIFAFVPWAECVLRVVGLGGGWNLLVIEEIFARQLPLAITALPMMYFQ
jgi:hypothetical protein